MFRSWNKTRLDENSLQFLQAEDDLPGNSPDGSKSSSKRKKRKSSKHKFLASGESVPSGGAQTQDTSQQFEFSQTSKIWKKKARSGFSKKASSGFGFRDKKGSKKHDWGDWDPFGGTEAPPKKQQQQESESSSSSSSEESSSSSSQDETSRRKKKKKKKKKKKQKKNKEDWESWSKSDGGFQYRASKPSVQQNQEDPFADFKKSPRAGNPFGSDNYSSATGFGNALNPIAAEKGGVLSSASTAVASTVGSAVNSTIEGLSMLAMSNPGISGGPTYQPMMATNSMTFTGDSIKSIPPPPTGMFSRLKSKFNKMKKDQTELRQRGYIPPSDSENEGSEDKELFGDVNGEGGQKELECNAGSSSDESESGSQDSSSSSSEEESSDHDKKKKKKRRSKAPSKQSSIVIEDALMG